MTPVHIERLILYSLSLLFSAILLGMVVTWIWAFQRIARGVPLAPQRPVRTPPTAHWGAGTILLVAALYIGTNLAVAHGYAALRAPSGANQVEAQVEAKAAPKTAEADKTADEAKRLTPLETILLTCVANLAFCALAFPILRWPANVRPSDLGLFVEHWPLQVWFGVIAALLATPTTYAIQMIATSIWSVREHEVQKMMMDQFTPAVAALALFTTVFLAPVVEETMFRGVLQRWLTRLFDPRPHSALPPPDPPAGPPDETSASSVSIAGDEPGSQLAIVTTSVLFAAMHGNQWPAPVALFVLSLVLGGLYQKTGSLLAVMVTHGVFNGFSTLLLIAQLSAHHIKG